MGEHPDYSLERTAGPEWTFLADPATIHAELGHGSHPELNEAAQRMASLSPRSRHVTQVASMLGATFRAQDLAELMRETVASLLPAVEEALAANLLCCHGERLGFSDASVQHAISDLIPSPVRCALRAEAELVLTRRPANTQRQSGSESADTVDNEARLQGKPRNVFDPDHEGHPRSPILHMVDAHLAGGRLDAAAAVARAELAQPQNPVVAAELQCRLAHVLILTGDAPAAVAATHGPLTEPDLPVHVRDNALAARLLALSLYDDAAARAECQSLLDECPSRDSGGSAVVIAGTVLALSSWQRGELAIGLRVARASVDRISATTPPVWRPHARLALARMLADSREFDEARAVIAVAEEEIEQYAVRVHRASPAIAKARVFLRLGDFAAARQEALLALSAAQEQGTVLLVPLAHSVLATAALRTGDLLAAAQHVNHYRSSLAGGATALRSVQYDWVELLLAAEQDGLRHARDFIAARLGDAGPLRALFVEEPGAAAWLVRLSRAKSDTELGRLAVATVDTLATANPMFPSLVAGERHAWGVARQNQRALAFASMEHNEPWAAAWAAEDLGMLRSNLGAAQVGPALSDLQLALRRFERIGAERDASRVRRRLRGMGVPSRRATRFGAPSCGWEAMSDMERTIAHLVNQGLTNRQIATRVFLSPHTVNYHLRHIFRKLSIGSRVELARLTQLQRVDVSG